MLVRELPLVSLTRKRSEVQILHRPRRVDRGHDPLVAAGIGCCGLASRSRKGGEGVDAHGPTRRLGPRPGAREGAREAGPPPFLALPPRIEHVRVGSAARVEAIGQRIPIVAPRGMQVGAVTCQTDVIAHVTDSGERVEVGLDRRAGFPVVSKEARNH